MTTTDELATLVDLAAAGDLDALQRIGERWRLLEVEHSGSDGQGGGGG